MKMLCLNPLIFHPRNLVLRTKQKRFYFIMFIPKRDRNMCKEPIGEFCTAKHDDIPIFFYLCNLTLTANTLIFNHAI